MARLLATDPVLPPPNILWLVLEDTSPRFLGPYGDPLARTPVADSLARKGLVLDRVYTAPVCAPSRSSLATGRYASSMGTHHMRSTRPLPDGVRFFAEYLRDAGYYCTNNAKTDYNTSTSWDRAWDENSPAAHWRKRTPGQPFFAIFNFNQTHEQHLHARRKLVTDPARVRVPAFLPDTPVVRADLAQNYDNVAAGDALAGEILAGLEADGLAENTIVFYYSDHGGGVAGSKRFLNDAGTHAAVLAYFPPRYAHLAPAQPGSRITELIHFVDFGPTMLSLAGVPAGPQFQGRAFAGPARTAAPEYAFAFRGRMDERFDESRAVMDGRYRYVRNYHPDRPWGQRIEYLWRAGTMQEWQVHHRSGVLNAAQRRFFEPKGTEELYDERDDPDNVRNLAADPRCRETLLRLRAALRRHQLAVRDTALLPETMMIALAAGRSPAVVATDDQAYPLARLLDVVDAMQLGDADASVRALRAAHGDTSAVLRYWAAVAALVRPEAFDARTLLDDADATVRLAAAEAVLRQGGDQTALQVVEKAVRQKELPELCLFALNVLERLPGKPPSGLRPLLGEFSAFEGDGGMDYYISRASRLLLER